LGELPPDLYVVPGPWPHLGRPAKHDVETWRVSTIGARACRSRIAKSTVLKHGSAIALEGDGTSGQMGVKNITAHLNRQRISTRDGGRWGIGQVHRILTRATHIGRHEFNKRSKSKELKPVSEVIAVEVPPLIDQATFDAVQTHLRARNPKVTPARVVSGPTLLTGICFCADCGGAMTLRTGKGGRYRYYTCSIKPRQGETGCKGRSIPMEKLDNLVAGHIEKRLLQPERLEEILASVLDRRQERTERRREHIAELNKRAAETDLRLKPPRRHRKRDRRAGRPGIEGAHCRSESQPRPSPGRRRPRPGDGREHGPAGDHARYGPEIRNNRPIAAIKEVPAPHAHPSDPCADHCRHDSETRPAQPTAGGLTASRCTRTSRST
jgi:Recombinase zinc beta ribbon domain/Recombinase